MDAQSTPRPGQRRGARDRAEQVRRDHDTTAPVPRLLDRLDGARQTGADRWHARCPAHEDRSPSLTIRQADDRVVIDCRAGCHADDILAAVGLAWTDVYDRDRAAYEAAIAHAAHRIGRRLPATLDHDRAILTAARAALTAGRALSAWDRARAEVAVERLEAGR